MRDEKAAKEQRRRRQQQREAKRFGNQRIQRSGFAAEPVQREKRQQGCRNAAERKPADQRPVDRAVKGMDGRAAGLGDAGIEKVGADRRCGVHTEEENEERGHQRSTADTGQPDDEADRKSGRDEQRIDVLDEIHGRLPKSSGMI